jgi:hypothetical protein
MVRGERKPENNHSQSDAPMATGGDDHGGDDDDECDQLNRTNDHEFDDNIMTTMPIAMLLITTTTMTTMTTMMKSKYISSAMILFASRAGTLAIVRVEITDVQTTTALTAASKDTARGFARMCSVITAIFLVT